MSKDQVLGLVRHILTFGGGFLVTSGTVDDTLITEAIGAFVTLVGAVWSIAVKKKA